MDNALHDLDCSDEEKYDMKPREDGTWEPSGEVIAELFGKLEEEGGVLELEWKCRGRRAPTPDPVPTNTHDLNLIQSHHLHQQQAKDEYFDFEVLDKGGEPTRLRPSGDVGPRGSAKKKTTSLHAILSNMARHRRMDMMDQHPQSPPPPSAANQQQQQQQQQ